jgi:hypothetical protein
MSKLREVLREACSPLVLPKCSLLIPELHKLHRKPNMRGLDESTEALLRTGQKAQEQVRHAWDGFINFAARDNVLEVALGLMLVLPLHNNLTTLLTYRSHLKYS